MVHIYCEEQDDNADNPPGKNLKLKYREKEKKRELYREREGQTKYWSPRMET